MSYTFKDIPLATDLISVSQADLKGNFDYIQGALGKDHQIVFGDSDTGTSFEGRHLQVSFKDRGGAVANPGDGTSSFLYDNGGNLIWNNATVANVQMTNVNVGVPSAIQNKGYTWLPGGMMICWGTQLATDTNPVIFPNGGFSTVFVVVGNTSANDRAFGITAVGPGSFTYSVLNPANVKIFWHAIGAK